MVVFPFIEIHPIATPSDVFRTKRRRAPVAGEGLVAFCPAFRRKNEGLASRFEFILRRNNSMKNFLDYVG
jgi:hypothetical protein